MDFAPQAVRRLQADAPGCARKTEELGLFGGTIRAVRTWGGRAQVKLTGDTVFLVRLPQGWKVAAAGCRPQAEGSSDCAVEV